MTQQFHSQVFGPSPKPAGLGSLGGPGPGSPVILEAARIREGQTAAERVRPATAARECPGGLQTCPQKHLGSNVRSNIMTDERWKYRKVCQLVSG